MKRRFPRTEALSRKEDRQAVQRDLSPTDIEKYWRRRALVESLKEVRAGLALSAVTETVREWSTGELKRKRYALETDLFAGRASLLALVYRVAVLARARRQHTIILPLIVPVLYRLGRLFAAREQFLQETKKEVFYSKKSERAAIL